MACAEKERRVHGKKVDALLEAFESHLEMHKDKNDLLELAIDETKKNLAECLALMRDGIIRQVQG